MKRKDFLRASLEMGLASGGLMIFGCNGARAQSAEKPQEQKPKDEIQLFREAWLISLMTNMEIQMDGASRQKLMEACGRDCAGRSGILKLASSCQGDVSKLVESLAKVLGQEGNFIKGNVVHLNYPKCYCELVAAGPDRLPATYCQCSKGWILQVFETAGQKPVQVEMVQTIKQGASSCKFLVTL